MTCVFESQPATLRCLPRLLVHDHITVEGVTLDLNSPANQLLALDFLWDLIRREEDLGLASEAATSVGLPRDVVELLARRRQTQIGDRGVAAAARGELTRARRRAEELEGQAARHDAIQNELRAADGDLDSLLEVTASMTGALVLFEDSEFQLVRWASGAAPRATTFEPRALADLLTPGRLHRLAAELEPGRVSTVALGTPAAGTRLVMRLSSHTLGYLTVAEWSATNAEGAAQVLHQLEGPFVAALRLERDRATLAADLRTHIVRLLAAGTLSPSDATAAAEHAGWHRAHAARMAALLPTAHASDSADSDLDADCRRAQTAGFAAAVHDGYVAVLLTSGAHDIERLWRFIDDVPSMAAGLGETVDEASAAEQSFRQAAWAARMATTSARRVLDFDDLGVHRLLIPGAQSGDELLEAPIQRLEEATPSLGFDPVETLTVYLDAGASPAEAARRLNVHVNSMRYRLGRIAQIAGLELADPEQRFRAHLALRIRASRLFLRSQLP